MRISNTLFCYQSLTVTMEVNSMSVLTLRGRNERRVYHKLTLILRLMVSTARYRSPGMRKIQGWYVCM